MRVLNYRRLAAVAALLMLAGLAATLGPPRAEAAGPQLLTADWHLTSQVFGEPACKGNICRVTIDETIAYSGELNGESTVHNVLIYPENQPDRFIITYTETFTGSAGTCGSGSLTWRGLITSDPLVGHFVVKSGTGDLAGFKGVGRLNINPDIASGTIELLGRC
jgi:hypothetical protein